MAACLHHSPACDDLYNASLDYSKDENYNCSASHTVALKLDDPVVQAAIRGALRKDPALAKKVVATNSTLKGFLNTTVEQKGPNTISAALAAQPNGSVNGVAKPQASKALVAAQSPFAAVAEAVNKAKAAVAALDPITQDRINKTNINTASGNFSMLLSISQKLVNASFSFLYQLTPELKKISIKTKRDGSIEADLLAPKVSFGVSGSSTGTILYYLNFGKTGTCTIWDDEAGPDKDGDFITMSTQDWVFVFAVNLTMQGMSPTDPQYNKIKAKFGKPGDYRISTLLADFQTADIMNPRWDLSSFGTTPMSSSRSTGFKTFVMKWLENAQKAGGGTLGYSITTGNPASVDSLAPTFPPTDQIFQCYPYYAQGQRDPTDGLGARGDNNMLLYLNMTENLAFPRERFLPYSANWSTPDIPATMCISKQVFFDRFLLRTLNSGGTSLLPLLNKATYIEATGASASYKFFTYSYGYQWGAGSYGNDFYNWIPKADGTGWTWNKSSEKNAHDGVDGFDCWSKIKATVDNDITIIPGTNQLKITGKTWMSLGQGASGFGISQNGTATITETWGLTVTINSILQGGLEIKMPVPTDLFKIDTSVDASFLQPNSDVSKIANDLKTWAQNNPALTNTANYLQGVLQKTGAFVLPGGGTFLYKNAIFNKNHDLLVEAQYDGVQ